VDAFVEDFASPNLAVSESMQELIDSGKATFVKIDDGPGYSLLKDLESFAYRDDGVALFYHNAEQPYLGCISGEKMKKELLAQMCTTITKFQQEHFGRTKGGRPPNMEERKRMHEIDRKPISNIAKAAELAPGGDQKQVKSKEVVCDRQHVWVLPTKNFHS
jgi:hypothetical protein